MPPSKENLSSTILNCTVRYRPKNIFSPKPNRQKPSSKMTIPRFLVAGWHGPSTDSIDTLRKIRIKKGITQQQVAYAMGIKREYYNQMEAGKISPSIDKVEQAAAAMDCTLEVIDNKPIKETL